MMPRIKNWDNRTWISSKQYILSFNNFLLKQKKLNKQSRILDIGCGRGKIMGSLLSKLRLANKPIGLDIENHKDVDKRILFKNINAIKYLKNSKKNFDLILIKQTIHLFNLGEIKKLLDYAYLNLEPNGMILIMSLDPKNNEIPTFSLMKEKLRQSFNKETIIRQNILRFQKKIIFSKFNFKVNITKKKYIKMIEQRFISSLLKLSANQILKGIEEIESRYKNSITFKDKLNCMIIKKPSSF
tara:strand:- start:423 stop:1148 length:726 start_codon:yes stop_codon:yes gene_type:complete